MAEPLVTTEDSVEVCYQHSKTFAREELPPAYLVPPPASRAGPPLLPRTAPRTWKAPFNGASGPLRCSLNALGSVGGCYGKQGWWTQGTWEGLMWVDIDLGTTRSVCGVQWWASNSEASPREIELRLAETDSELTVCALLAAACVCASHCVYASLTK